MQHDSKRIDGGRKLMKIDEAIKKIKKTTAIQVKQESEQEGSLMTFYAYGRSYNNDWFLAMRNDTPGWFGVEINYRYIKGVSAKELAYFMDIIRQLLNTPVKERFPEKKYVLSAMRCAEGPVPIKQYVNAIKTSTNNVEFHFGFADEKADAMEFTQKELDDLSDFFPKVAIDAMKEPVGNKDE